MTNMMHFGGNRVVSQISHFPSEIKDILFILIIFIALMRYISSFQ